MLSTGPESRRRATLALRKGTSCIMLEYIHESPRCTALKLDGTPCKGPAVKPLRRYCPRHQPPPEPDPVMTIGQPLPLGIGEELPPMAGTKPIGAIQTKAGLVYPSKDPRLQRLAEIQKLLDAHAVEVNERLVRCPRCRVKVIVEVRGEGAGCCPVCGTGGL